MDLGKDTLFPIRQYVEALRERPWIIVTVTAIIVTAVTIGSLLMTPIYLARTSLQIEQGIPRILPFDDVRVPDYGGSAGTEFYRTQYELLQSRAVARRAAIALDLLNEPLLLDELIGDGAGEAADPQKPVIEYVLDNLRIEPLRSTHIVNVEFLAHDPRLSARVANAVAEAYMDFISEAKNRTTTEASSLIGSQVAALKEEIAVLEADLGEVARKSEITSIEQRDDITVRKLEILNADYVAAQLESSRKKAHYENLLETSASSLPEVLADPLLQRLRHQDAELERLLAQKSGSFKDGWPEMRRLHAERESIARRIMEETDRLARAVTDAAETDYKSALQHERTVQAALDAQKEEAIERKRRSARYGNLQAAIRSKQDLLSALLKREGETHSLSGIEDDLRSNVWVIDRAEPPESPYMPKIPLNIAIALVSGLMVGGFMAIVADRLDSRLKTIADAERCADVPILGSVPGIAQGSRGLRLVGGDDERSTPALDLITHLEPQSPVAESYREIRTSLLFSVADHPPRHLAVSSGQPLEGKSTTSLNLAISLAQAGRRILLVDTDLRRPRLHRTFGLRSSIGISGYLSGNASFDDLVQETEVPGLSIVTSGRLPPNPSELLNSRRLDEFRDRLTSEGRFDHVIYDSSPILSVADATILAKRVEGTLLVVRIGHSTRETVSRSLDKLRQVDARVVGMVVNGAVRSRADYYRYAEYRAAEEGSASPEATGRASNRGRTI